jgi:hypothetical protein
MVSKIGSDMNTCAGTCIAISSRRGFHRLRRGLASPVCNYLELYQIQ